MKSFKIPKKLSLSRREKSYKLLQKAASVGLWEVFIESNTVKWSDTTKRIHEVCLDYDPSIEEAINFYKEGFHRDKISRDFNNSIETGEEFDEEYIIVTKSGKEKWVRSVGVPVFNNGKCVKVYGVFQDIDQQKKAEALIYQSEEKFQQTFESAPNGVALVSLDGKWIKANKQLSTILGYTEEELLTRTFQELTYPDDLAKDLKNVNRLLAGVDDNYQIEKRYIHKSGDIIWCILSVSLVRTKHKTPSYFISQITNISSLKNANKKIELLLEETESKNNKLLNFKHIVSHNLRSHTSNLDMLLGFLENDVPQVKDVEVFSLLKEAFKNLQETIVNLSDISGFENCRKEDYIEVDLCKEIERSIVSIKALLDEVNCNISFSKEDAIKVTVIPEYLRSSFLNILTNAVKYRKQTEVLNITIKIDISEDYTIVSFKDNGLGINLDLHGSKIFGMYKTFHRHPDSRGLGLFIVKNQIEAMGGKVLVESEEGIGTTFKIYLKK
ncbi:PAS domain-containing sensor histidine kinase [Dokdonia sp. Hel_I_53]|uniref:sensor histidine kinase n=1 Tax=Dokdonia sp. Hel_I_53 TaxID=1566287 RepID=UPI001199AA43|nr:PAS domain-containing sensor histidine kinase [Dokdonia sp. Hel_I_53]TVZ52486.1 PAS domain S-box-containing protein [Dokdonia sp. Hel_I_53]